MTDIVERLNKTCRCVAGCEGRCKECPETVGQEAIDLIKTLRASVAELTEFNKIHKDENKLLRAELGDWKNKAIYWDGMYKRERDLYDKQTNELAALKAGQGEPVARLHIMATDTHLEAKVEVLDGTALQVANSPVNVYTQGTQASSLAQPPTIPEGWQLVPIEPSVGMIKAWDDSLMKVYKYPQTKTWIKSYKAMLSAAPQPTEEKYD